MFHRHCVPKAVYDSLLTQYSALFTAYQELRVTGANPQIQRQARVVPPPPSPDDLALKRLHDSHIDSLAKAIESAPNIDKDVARAEAQRLRQMAFGADGGP